MFKAKERNGWWLQGNGRVPYQWTVVGKDLVPVRKSILDHIRKKLLPKLTPAEFSTCLVCNACVIVLQIVSSS